MAASLPSRSAPRPLRHLPSVFALLGVLLAVRMSILADLPLGSVRGHVIMDENGRPLGHADIYLFRDWATRNNSGEASRYAVTAADGSFKLNNVVAGTYRVSANSEAHSSKETTITVVEGGMTPVELSASRSNAELEVLSHQRIYGTGEKAHISVRGYVETGKHPDAFHLTIYKTRLSSIYAKAGGQELLQSIGRSYDPAPDLPPALLKTANGEPAPTAISRGVVISEGDREGFFYQRVELGTLKPGLYLLRARHAGATVCNWLMVTDTALVMKTVPGQLVGYVVDMRSGTPIPGCDVSAYRNGKRLGAAATDARGLAQLTFGPGEPSADHPSGLSAIAVRGDDEAFVGGNQFGNASQDYRVYTYTDRPIYRPGQRISFKGIARRKIEPSPPNGLPGPSDRSASTAYRYAVPAGAPVKIEARDPAGDRVFTERTTCNGFGSFAGAFDLDAEAQTGTYTLLVNVGGEESTETVIVASYRKPEFEIDVKPVQETYTRGGTVRMKISAHYYFGAPMVGQAVKYAVSREPDWSSPADEDEDDESGEHDPPMESRYVQPDNYYGSDVASGTVNLDDTGAAIVEFKDDSPTDPDAPQREKYTLTATISEGEDREVSADGAVIVAAGDYRLNVQPDGYVAAPGAPMSVIVTTTTQDGKPAPSVKVALETSFEEWKHGNAETSSGDWTFETKPAGTYNGVSGADGRALITVTAPRAGELTLRVVATDSHGRVIAERSSIWVAGDTADDLDTQYQDLSLLTDKRRYQPGQTARVLINTDRVGQTVLLTVEGRRVYSALTVPIRKHSTVVYVPVRADYGPNVWLDACYVKNKHFATSQTKLRVATPQRGLNVAVKADRDHDGSGPPARYHPGDPISYAVRTTDPNGNPVAAEVSVGVVDESIFALMEEHPERMREAFYPSQGDDVDTEYSFAITYLGDADKSEPRITARKKFQDTAYWSPFVRTNADGRATVRFNLPDNLTEWRATVVAHSLDTRLGWADEHVTSSKDFFVRLQTPRSLTEKDQSRFTVLVHNETGETQQALVRLQGDHIQIGGDSTQTLAIEPGKIAEAVWPVTASQFGAANLRLTAWTPKIAGKPRFSDGIETTLPIRARGREQAVAFAGELTGSHPETEILRLDPNAVPSLSRVTVRLTPSLIAACAGSLDYLVGYPYGCTEQTMSRFLPDLVVHRLVGSRGGPATANVPKMVANGLQRLYKFQHQSGAWGWWEHDEDDAWMTAYVLYGLSIARAEGFEVSANVLQRALTAAGKLAEQTPSEKRSFLLYGMALCGGDAEARKQLAELHEDRMGPEGLAYTLMLKLKLGLDPKETLARLNARSITDGTFTHWRNGTDSQFDWDDLTTTAIALQGELAVNSDNPRVATTIRWLMARRSGDYWSSTRDTAFVLLALSKYLGRFRNTTDDIATGDMVGVYVNDRFVEHLNLEQATMNEVEIKDTVSSSLLKPGKNEVRLQRVTGGGAPVFYSLDFKQTVEGEEMPAIAAGKLTVTREYLRLEPDRDKDGNWTMNAVPTHDRMKEGDRIRVRLTIHVPNDMAYVLIEEPFPAGCEVSERGTAEDVVEWGYWWSSIDVRDDRVAFFARWLRAGDQVIEYNLRAQTPGSYHALPTLVQPMYQPEIRSETAEARVEIK